MGLTQIVYFIDPKYECMVELFMLLTPKMNESRVFIQLAQHASFCLAFDVSLNFLFLPNFHNLLPSIIDEYPIC